MNPFQLIMNGHGQRMLRSCLRPSKTWPSAGASPLPNLEVFTVAQLGDHQTVLYVSPGPSCGRFLRLSILLTAILCVSCGQQSQIDKPAAPSPPPAVAVTPVQYPSPVIGQPYPGTGVVTLINFPEGWIEIRHEEIKGLMPAMEMEWWVKDKSLLKSVQVGDKVDFTVVETGKGEFITSLKKKPADP